MNTAAVLVSKFSKHGGTGWGRSFQHIVIMRLACAAQVIKEAIYDAFYKLTDSRSQITAYVFDVVRASVPRMDLDEIFVVRLWLHSVNLPAVRRGASAMYTHHPLAYLAPALLATVVPTQRP